MTRARGFDYRTALARLRPQVATKLAASHNPAQRSWNARLMKSNRSSSGAGAQREAGKKPANCSEAPAAEPAHCGTAYIHGPAVPLQLNDVCFADLPEHFSMRVIVESDKDGVSRRAAQFVGNLVRRRPTCVLGLATGGKD